jgi:DNA helicase-2/ATP-dependent DNA helicase PcrA
VLVGGQSFFDRKEVRDLFAYLKVLVQPDDEVSLLRIINTPTRGIGDASVEKVLARAVKTGLRFWDAVPPAAAAKEINAKTATAMQQFHDLLADYRQRLEQPGVRLSDVAEQLLDAIDYNSEIQRQYKESHMQLARSGVIDECVTAIREYEQRALRPSLLEFLEQTTLAGNETDFGEKPELEKPAVKLMTLHSAKGLEFPRVYLVGLEEGLLPHQRSVDADDTASIEEERRLAYVGVTRARDYLTISWAMGRMKWGKRRETIPSRFLVEMQDEE